MTKEDLLNLHDELTQKAKAIMVKKNQDYTGGSENPFENFLGSLALDVEPEIGLMIRMMDKFQRAKSFVKLGVLAVEDEGIDDIGWDLINCSVLLTGMLRDRNLEMCKMRFSVEYRTFKGIESLENDRPTDEVVMTSDPTIDAPVPTDEDEARCPICSTYPCEHGGLSLPEVLLDAGMTEDTTAPLPGVPTITEEPTEGPVKDPWAI